MNPFRFLQEGNILLRPTKTKTVFDLNDYSFCLTFDGDTGKTRLYCEAAPEAQIGAAQADAMSHTVVTDLGASVTLNANGYRYEITFPQRSILPLKLADGQFERFAFYVNDNDGEGRKGGLVSTVDPDSEPFQNPEQ